MTRKIDAAGSAATLRTVRRILFGILVLGMVGTTIELVLLKHLESTIQLIPLASMGAAFLALAWHGLRPSAAAVRTLQGLMAVFVVAGGFGVFFHYRANVEFQLESDPTLKGRALVMKALQAKAPPALAPGVMAQLGLIGLAAVYKHPALGKIAATEEEKEEGVE